MNKVDFGEKNLNTESHELLSDLNRIHPFQAGEADDYEIICKDGSFGIHEHCLFSSDFLYKQHRARKNFDDKGKETRLMLHKLCR